MEREKEERCRWYRDLVLEHRIGVDLRKAVLSALVEEHPAKVIALYGPTGVGKTTLSKSLARMVRGTYGHLGPECMPVVEMECPSSEVSYYDFNREHNRVILESMDDMFIDRHMDPEEAAKRAAQRKRTNRLRRKSTGRDLQRAVEQKIRLRKTKLFIMDEAQHMVNSRRSRSSGGHLDAIKSFGNRTGVKQLLVGTDELHPLCGRMRR